MSNVTFSEEFDAQTNPLGDPMMQVRDVPVTIDNPLSTKAVATYQYIVTDYKATVDKPVDGFPGSFYWQIGDFIQNVRCYDITDVTTTGNNLPNYLNQWFNLTKGTQFGSPIAYPNILTDLLRL